MVVLPASRNPHCRDTGSRSSLALLADTANVWNYVDKNCDFRIFSDVAKTCID